MRNGRLYEVVHPFWSIADLVQCPEITFIFEELLKLYSIDISIHQHISKMVCFHHFGFILST